VIIQCPYCSTRFHLDESRLSSSFPMLKCSRCRHIFPGPTPPSPPPAPAPAEPKSPPAKVETLSFTFPEERLKEPGRGEPDLTIDEPEPEFELGADLPPASPKSPAVPPEAPPPDEQEDDEEAEEDLAPPPSSRRPGASRVENVDEDEQYARVEDFDDEFLDEPVAEAVDMSRGISVRPVLIFLAVVVAGYGAIAWTLRSDTDLADSLFRKLPFISSITEDRLLNRKVVLSEVSGGYQRIKDGQTVFVITGRALNNAAVTVRNVQILGRLFDTNAQQVDEKSIFCGNVISLKILRSLTQREVSILQDLKPPKRFGIAPGEESTFVIVFMQPPPGVTEFSSQVISAQRQA
jgi:predicted Zn finger-like uncharacterized protein